MPTFPHCSFKAGNMTKREFAAEILRPTGAASLKEMIYVSPTGVIGFTLEYVHLQSSLGDLLMEAYKEVARARSEFNDLRQSRVRRLLENDTALQMFTDGGIIIALSLKHQGEL